MRKKQIFSFLATAMLCCCAMFMQTSCVGEDNPASPTDPAASAQLKQGVWTEYDEALLTSGKYTEEELANMPAVGMMVEGDKGYFFTYTAEGADDLVEGKIIYDNKTGKGTIAFPTITDSPISGQTVSFSMTSDETMQFEFTYDGKKTTGTCAWLCENLDNWGEGDESGWEELLPYYQAISETAGPDGSIDWSASEAVTVEDVDDEGHIVEKEVTVTDLDKPLEPLELNNGASSRANTRVAAAVIEGISAGLEIFSSLFEPDPMEEINAKLDAALGKLDQVLTNQQQMMAKVNEMNARLIAIAQMMKKQETVGIFNNRTQTYYNPLKVRNTAYFDAAFKLYNDNKSDLSQVKTQLGNYAKTWVGNNEEYITLTWNYIEYLKTVQHSSYGTGMAAIYDGLTFEKYPWEHMGIGDRQNYRAYDMIMIAKSLFMINLYAAYGGLSDIQKGGLYNNYNNCKPTLKEFCEFKVSNPDKFRVCQIPGAHFVMHKEIQYYDYKGNNNEAPDLNKYGKEVCYRPEWHKAGKIKIENPKELLSKLIYKKEAEAIFNYYKPTGEMMWPDVLAKGHKMAGGAVFAKDSNPGELPSLLSYDPNNPNMYGLRVSSTDGAVDISRTSFFIKGRLEYGTLLLGYPTYQNGKFVWKEYYRDNVKLYAAIIEKRY